MGDRVKKIDLSVANQDTQAMVLVSVAMRLKLIVKAVPVALPVEVAAKVPVTPGS